MAIAGLAMAWATESRAADAADWGYIVIGRQLPLLYLRICPTIPDARNLLQANDRLAARPSAEVQFEELAIPACYAGPARATPMSEVVELRGGKAWTPEFDLRGPYKFQAMATAVDATIPGRWVVQATRYYRVDAVLPDGRTYISIAQFFPTNIVLQYLDYLAAGGKPL